MTRSSRVRHIVHQEQVYKFCQMDELAPNDSDLLASDTAHTHRIAALAQR